MNGYVNGDTNAGNLRSQNLQEGGIYDNDYPYDYTYEHNDGHIQRYSMDHQDNNIQGHIHRYNGFMDGNMNTRIRKGRE